jgi:hypothetical protein
MFHRPWLMENRSGLIVDARLTRVSGHAERLAALDMIEGFADRPRAVTLAADKGYDAADFVEELRTINVRPHVARNTSGRTGFVEGDEICGSGSAELEDDGTIEIELSFHNDDDVILKARLG